MWYIEILSNIDQRNRTENNIIVVKFCAVWYTT